MVEITTRGWSGFGRLSGVTRRRASMACWNKSKDTARIMVRMEVPEILSTNSRFEEI